MYVTSHIFAQGPTLYCLRAAPIFVHPRITIIYYIGLIEFIMVQSVLSLEYKYVSFPYIHSTFISDVLALFWSRGTLGCHNNTDRHVSPWSFGLIKAPSYFAFKFVNCSAVAFLSVIVRR